MIGFILLGGAIVGAISQSIATAVQVKQSKKAAARNRDFQREMRSTQMQARVEDLKLAGLNPILAAGGPGAASPGGNMAQVPDIAGSTAKGIANIHDALRLKSQLKSEHTSRGLLRAQTAEQLTRAEYNVYAGQGLEASTAITASKLPAAKKQQDAVEKYPLLKWINIIRRSVTGASD